MKEWAKPVAPEGVYKLGGYSFIASALFFASAFIFEQMGGPPPLAGADIVAWSQSSKLALAMLNETLFFAAIFLIPGSAALYFSLAETGPGKAIMGCGIMAVAISILPMLLIVQGRLVFPVYGIWADTPGAAALAVAIFYGGMHALYILFGIATMLLSLSMLNSAYGKGIAYLGIVTSVLDVAAAYQYAIGPILTLLCHVFFIAWFIAVGLAMLRIAKGESATSGSDPLSKSHSP